MTCTTAGRMSSTEEMLSPSTRSVADGSLAGGGFGDSVAVGVLVVLSPLELSLPPHDAATRAAMATTDHQAWFRRRFMTKLSMSGLGPDGPEPLQEERTADPVPLTGANVP